jgi:hypothetical protein
MKYSPLLIIHISGALVGLVSGWSAIFLRKGSRWHGVTGNVFFVSILTMCASAVTIAVMKQQTANIIAGVLTSYLVATAWSTARSREGRTSNFEWGAMAVAFALSITTLTLGWQAAQSANRSDVPLPVYFIFGSVALLAAAGDARMLRRGGVAGGPRVARHLWRMCTTLLIATSSALSGNRTHIFPEGIRNAHLFGIPVLTLPVFLTPILMIYWLVRVRFVKNYRRKLAAPNIKTSPANTLA